MVKRGLNTCGRLQRLLVVFAVMVGAITFVTAPAALALDGAVPPMAPKLRKALVAAVCQGKVMSSTCSICPTTAGSADDGLPITVGPFHVGAFITAGATEAYVGLNGCDGKPAGFTGGVLLRQTKGVWKVLRYDSGANLNACLRFRYETGTSLLACYGYGGGQGYAVESVIALYTGPSETLFKPIFSVQDNSAACRPTIDVVMFRSWRAIDLNRDKKQDLEVRVDESHMPGNENECEPESEPGKVVTHRIGFLFDGKRFTVSPKAKATVACLSSDELGESVPTKYCPTVA
jgi:hypothetical protein